MMAKQQCMAQHILHPQWMDLTSRVAIHLSLHKLLQSFFSCHCLMSPTDIILSVVTIFKIKIEILVFLQSNQNQINDFG